MPKNVIENDVGRKTHKCKECDTIYSNNSVLKRHKVSVHDRIKRYICSLCDYISYKKRAVLNHVKKVHIGTKVSIIDISSNDDKQISGSMETKLKKATYIDVKTTLGNRYHCTVCKYTGRTQNVLVFHMQIEHGSTKLFACHSCKYSCNNLSNLNNHKDAKHSG